MKSPDHFTLHHLLEALTKAGLHGEVACLRSHEDAVKTAQQAKEHAAQVAFDRYRYELRPFLRPCHQKRIADLPVSCRTYL